jgi:hypothetical protein
VFSFATWVGTFVRRFGSQGSGPGQFQSSCDIAVADDRVYVKDSENDRVQVYS